MRRGTIWWTLQSIVFGGLTVTLVFLAFWNPSTEATIAAVAALVLGPLLIFMAIKQIKSLRHGYRYSDEEPQQAK